MSRTKIGLKGIVRNVPESTVKDGACEEVINMRYRDEGWRPVSKKSDFGCMPMDFERVWVHKGNDYVHFIGYKDKTLYYFDKDTCKVVQTIKVGDEVTSVSFVGNLMKVAGKNDVYDYLFADEEYVLISGVRLPVLDISIEDTEKDNGKIVDKKVEQWMRQLFGGDALNVEKLKKNDELERKKLIDYSRGLYDKACQTPNKKGWFEGFVLLRYAFRMYDGSYYYFSPPLCVSSFNSFYKDTTVNVEYTTLDKGDLTHAPEVVVVNDDFEVKNSPPVLILDPNGSLNVVVRLGRIKISVKFTEEFTGVLQKIFRSVVVFITRPISTVDFDSIGYRNGFIHYGGFENIEKKLLQDTNPFYKVDEIPIDKIQKGYEKVLEFDENTMTSLPTLNEDFTYMHKDIPAVSKDYNSRFLNGDITTRLFGGYSVDYFSNLGNVRAGGYRVFVQTELDIDGGKVVNSEILFISQSEYDKGVLNSLLSYPDTRATKLTVFVEEIASRKCCYKSFQLKESKTFNLSYFLNLDDVDEDFSIKIGNGKEGIYHKYPTPAMIPFDKTDWSCVLGGKNFADWILSLRDDIIHEPNKVKVSELNNPLVYPAKNTYLVGKGEVLGFASNAVALSQGQFGQYPLFVFTSEGMWALEQGSGEVLYKSVVPLNREVCNNPKSITQLDRSTVFTTEKGLMMIVGVEVREISIPVEGVPEKLQENNVTYEKAVNYSQLVELKNSHSTVSFKEYLKGALFGYDYENKELVVSNGDYPYSYVYRLDVGVWHKTTEQYSSFVNNYPKTLGVGGRKLVDVSKEDKSDTQVLLQTKPLKFDTETYKAMRRLILRGLLKVSEGKVAGFYIFGSYDAEKWGYLGGIQNKNEFRDMVAKTLRTDCKYFKIVFAGQVGYDSYVNYLELEVLGELQGRLR